MTAIVFNAVFPYRTPVFDLLGDDYTVIYSCKREANRQWELSELCHKHIFLKERTMRLGWESFRHINLDILTTLGSLKPSCVVVYGFGLTEQLAFLWARWHKCPTVVWLDGWEHTEKDKSRRQVAIARFMVKRSAAFIASGWKSREYIVSLGAKPEDVFISRIVR